MVHQEGMSIIIHYKGKKLQFIFHFRISTLSPSGQNFIPGRNTRPLGHSNDFSSDTNNANNTGATNATNPNANNSNNNASQRIGANNIPGANNQQTSIQMKQTQQLHISQVGQKKSKKRVYFSKMSFF